MITRRYMPVTLYHFSQGETSWLNKYAGWACPYCVK